MEEGTQTRPFLGTEQPLHIKPVALFTLASPLGGGWGWKSFRGREGSTLQGLLRLLLTLPQSWVDALALCASAGQRQGTLLSPSLGLEGSVQTPWHLAAPGWRSPAPV